MKSFSKIILLVIAATACSARPESMEHLADRVFDLAGSQYTYLASQLDTICSPRTLNEDGTLKTSRITWWCSGFFPGSLWLIYDYGKSEDIKALAEKFTGWQKAILNETTSHDIGFQIQCSLGNALRITGDSIKYEDTVIKAARKLAERFSPVTGTTRSWDGNGGKWEYPVIIDNMMNLELLMNAYELCGEESFREIARTHSFTTMKNHFRPDYSTWHVVDYDPVDGSVRGRQTHQGWSDDSMWARGEAWALYGYTMMYERDGDSEFLVRAEHIADLLLEKLPEDGIPFWDFECNDYKDASAAAIMASAFVKLYSLDGNKAYLAIAQKQLRELAGPEYLSARGENCGFLVKHCVGNKPAGSEVDVPLTYADYYFLEALLRYSRLVP